MFEFLGIIPEECVPTNLKTQLTSARWICLQPSTNILFRFNKIRFFKLIISSKVGCLDVDLDTIYIGLGFFIVYGRSNSAVGSMMNGAY